MDSTKARVNENRFPNKNLELLNPNGGSLESL